MISEVFMPGFVKGVTSGFSMLETSIRCTEPLLQPTHSCVQPLWQLKQIDCTAESHTLTDETYTVRSTTSKTPERETSRCLR